MIKLGLFRLILDLKFGYGLVFLLICIFFTGFSPCVGYACNRNDIGSNSVLSKNFDKGVVAVSHPIAAKIGASIIEQGGNAVDAGAAIQFALNVVEPQFSGMGGSSFIMIYLSQTGETIIVDARAKAA
jgi:gamma-glutamyltranspeptidase